MNNKSLVAIKYATAFLNVYGDRLSINQCDALEQFECFLATDRMALLSCMQPNLMPQQKLACIQFLLKKFNLNVVFVDLVALLIADKKVSLLREVIRHTARLYKHRNNIVRCVFYISHNLDHVACEAIKEFITQKTGKTVVYTVVVDKNLIAGIRVQSNIFVWEYSILKQLNVLRSA